jgi:non-heme chloroperoxidase
MTANAILERTHHSITVSDGTRSISRTGAPDSPWSSATAGRLSADAWEDQMVFLGRHGYRCIAHDRRGHGRSSQPWTGNDMDTYADDLAALVSELDSTMRFTSATRPAAERSRAISDVTGPSRVAKAVLIGAVPPLMLKTAATRRGRRSRHSTDARRRARRPLADSSRT